MNEIAAVRGIEHIGVQVPDLDAAVSVFVDRLGFELRFRGRSPDETTRVAFVASGDAELEIFERPGEPARLEHLALRVTGDLADAGSALAARGVASVSGEVVGMRETQAILLEPEHTLGIRMHLSTPGPGAGG